MRQKAFKTLSFCAVTLVSLLALSNRPAFGQVEFGSMVGNVTDASGGAIPGASVKITLTSTNDTRTVRPTRLAATRSPR